jgi:opacity protein-like surface antigen
MRKLACLLMCLGAYTANADMGETQAPQTKAPKYHKAKKVSMEATNPFTGFYISAGLGGTNAVFDTNELLQIGNVDGDPAEPIGVAFPFEEDLYQNSAAAMVGLGYSYQFDMGFVLGIEATANYTNAKVTNTNTTQTGIPLLAAIQIENTLTAQLTNDFALLFKPGFMLTKSTQLYALVGPRWGNIETSISDNLSGVLLDGFISFDEFSFPNSVSESGYVLGITAGLGIEQMITDHLSVGLEYAYTSYGDLDTPSSNIFFDDIGLGGFPPGTRLLEDSADIDASSNTIMLTLTYR